MFDCHFKAPKVTPTQRRCTTSRLKLLEPLEPAQASNGIALPLLGIYIKEEISCTLRRVTERIWSLALRAEYRQTVLGKGTEDNVGTLVFGRSK